MAITYERRENTIERRQNSGKCRSCGHVESRLIRIELKRVRRSDQLEWRTEFRHVFNEAGEQLSRTAEFQTGRKCECGKPVIFKTVKGTVNEEKKCNDKCRSATGHVCECRCGGLNHGSNNG